MLAYVVRRVGWAVLVLWVIVTLTFGATFFSPIDPARSYAGARASAEVVENVRRELGLDQPLYVQYGRYLRRLAVGDLGESFSTGRPVLDSLVSRFPATAMLTLAAALTMLAIGVTLGLTAGLRRQTTLDRGIMGGSLLGVSIPDFVLGFALLYLLAFQLRVFPLGGMGGWRSLVLPALSLAIPYSAWYVRLVRSVTIGVASEEHVRFARAKGLAAATLVRRHIARNAMPPTVGMFGSDLGVFFGGVLVIERVFGWPGIGEQAWRAITFNDIPMVMGTVLFAGFFVVLFNLVADLVVATIDPRVRYS